MYTEAFYTQTLLHKAAFTHRCFTHRRIYTETLLHTKQLFTHRSVTQRSLYTQKLLHRGLWHTDIFSQSIFYTQKPLHAEAFTHGSLYKEQLPHRRFVQSSFCTQKPLQREAFTQGSLYTEHLFSLPHRHGKQTSLNTQKRLDRPAFTQKPFTHRRFYTEQLLHTASQHPEGQIPRLPGKTAAASQHPAIYRESPVCRACHAKQPQLRRPSVQRVIKRQSAASSGPAAVQPRRPSIQRVSRSHQVPRLPHETAAESHQVVFYYLQPIVFQQFRIKITPSKNQANTLTPSLCKQEAGAASQRAESLCSETRCRTCYAKQVPASRDSTHQVLRLPRETAAASQRPAAASQRTEAHQLLRCPALIQGS